MYFSFRGKVSMGLRSAQGNPLALRWLGNMPDFTLAFATDETKHTEAYSGLDLTDFVQENSRDATFTGTIEDYNANNAKIITRSRSTVIDPASAVTDVFPLALVAGDEVILAGQNLDPDVPFVLHDSATTPVVVPTSKYRVSPGSGTVTLLDVTGFTQPFRGTYSTLEVTQLALLTEAAVDYWLRFDGLDKATKTPIIVDLYRVNAKPTSEFGLIHKAQGSWKLDGSALVDPTKDANGPLGQFGRLITIGA